MRWGRRTPQLCPWRSRSPSCRPQDVRGSPDRGSETHLKLGQVSSMVVWPWPWYAIIASECFGKKEQRYHAVLEQLTKILMLDARSFFFTHLSTPKSTYNNHINHQTIKRFCWLNISVSTTVCGLKASRDGGRWWPNYLTKSSHNPLIIHN